MKPELIKITVPFLATIALAFGIASCSNSSNQDTSNKDSKEVAENKNDAKFDHAQSKDADFVMEAAIINMKEIKVSSLAADHGKLQSTKDLGKMMVDGHTKKLAELTDLAKQKGISIPTSLSDDDSKGYNDLIKDKPEDFDKDFSDMMVKEHKKAIDKFETAAKDCQDADIKLWASNTLPDLRHHLDMSMANQEKTKDMK